MSMSERPTGAPAEGHAVKETTSAPACVIEAMERFAAQFAKNPSQGFAAAELDGLVLVAAPAGHTRWLREGVAWRGGVVQMVTRGERPTGAPDGKATP